MREIVLDTETTGLDPLAGHRVVELGCIELVNTVATGKTFQAYFNPEMLMPAGAQDIHGLSDEFLADKPLFVDRAEEFLAFISDAMRSAAGSVAASPQGASGRRKTRRVDRKSRSSGGS